jgi:Radical SAM superfamily
VPETAAHPRFCLIPVFSNYNNLGQDLTVLDGDRVLARLPLLKRWNRYAVGLPESRGERSLSLTLRLNRLIPAASHPGDARDLGVRIGTLSFHDDAARHEMETARHANNVQRQRELLAGATVLSSTPSTLGIDLFGRCNIKPPCVYCPWERMKALEGANTNVAIDDGTLESYGALFRGAQSLVNCSFGEPLLHPRLEQILALVSRHRQVIELATNGQAFTARTVRALAGAPVILSVSLDAASPETYARIRNDRWHEILPGLLELREARCRAGGWPRVHMVFIPMQVNRRDVEDYFKLCRLVDADALALRPLLLEDSYVDTERGGYRFTYEREHLSPDELTELVAHCRTLAHRYGVRVMTQFDFGKVDFGVLTRPSAAPPEAPDATPA